MWLPTAYGVVVTQSTMRTQSRVPQIVSPTPCDSGTDLHLELGFVNAVRGEARL